MTIVGITTPAVIRTSACRFVLLAIKMTTVMSSRRVCALLTPIGHMLSAECSLSLGAWHVVCLSFKDDHSDASTPCAPVERLGCMPRLDLSEVASGVLQVGSVHCRRHWPDIVRTCAPGQYRGLDSSGCDFCSSGSADEDEDPSTACTACAVRHVYRLWLHSVRGV